MANRRGEELTDELTDEQWALLSVLIPEPSRRADGRGRPWRDNREVMNGILWILRSGARRQDLPDRFPSYQTCHHRFQQWARSGVLRDALEVLAQYLQERGKLDLSECFIDGTFIVPKKGDGSLEKPSGAKTASSWQAPSGQWQPFMVFHSPCTLHLLRRANGEGCNVLRPDGAKAMASSQISLGISRAGGSPRALWYSSAL